MKKRTPQKVKEKLSLMEKSQKKALSGYSVPLSSRSSNRKATCHCPAISLNKKVASTDLKIMTSQMISIIASAS